MYAIRENQSFKIHLLEITEVRMFRQDRPYAAIVAHIVLFVHSEYVMSVRAVVRAEFNNLGQTSFKKVTTN